VKYCPACKQHKPTTEFARNACKKDGLQTACRNCTKAWGQARYRLTKDQYRLRDDALRARNQEAVRAYLESHPCVDCPVTDPDVLTFDHIRGKKLGNVSDMAKHSRSLKTIFEEIAKCQVRCANCHLKKTRKATEAARAQKLFRASPTGLPSPVPRTAATS
jgi:hypothetical protein